MGRHTDSAQDGTGIAQRSSARGIVCVLLSAVSFATAGLLIKLIPWGSVATNGMRAIFAPVVVYAYLRSTGRRFHVNRSIVLGALVNVVMLMTFVMANKMTTAADAIVLQFTEPVWVIVLSALFLHQRPKPSALVTCAVVAAGIVCFFYESLGSGALAGDVLAVVSGAFYAGVFLTKQLPGCDFECSAILAYLLCFVIGIPFYVRESVFTPEVLAVAVLLGAQQLGLSYILLSKGLDEVNPVTASLLSTLEPVLNPILVALVVGETIGPLAMFGAFLVVGASIVYSIWSARHGDAEET